MFITQYIAVAMAKATIGIAQVGIVGLIITRRLSPTMTVLAMMSFRISLLAFS